MTTLGIYNDTLIKADETGYYSLTDMWKANGGKDSQRPYYWMRLPDTVNFLKELEKDTKWRKSPIDLVKTVRGGKMPGTWGTQKVAIAYAEYLSPEFHAWVLEAVATYVHHEEDPEAGLDHYTKATIKKYRKEGKPEAWIAERLDGKKYRNLMYHTACALGVNNEGMKILSQHINLAATGKQPFEIRRERNVKDTRDGLDVFEIQMIRTIEMALERIYSNSLEDFEFVNNWTAIVKAQPLLQQIANIRKLTERN